MYENPVQIGQIVIPAKAGIQVLPDSLRILKRLYKIKIIVI